jgi:type IV pilus assembly protein PilW
MTGKTFHASTHNMGFTLVELLVALALAAIFLLATMSIANMSIRSYGDQERVSDAQQSVRAALDLMVRDIRMAGYDPMAMSHGPTTGIGILTATETKLQFSADLNADQVDSGGTENLTYFYEAETKRLRQKEGPKAHPKTFKKEGGKPYPQTFIENVSDLKFSYLDANGGPPAGLEDIAVVVVALTVQNRYQKGGTFERTLTTRINCRNLRM